MSAPEKDFMSGWRQATRIGIKPVNFHTLGHWWQIGWQQGYEDRQKAERMAHTLGHQDNERL